MAIAAAAVACTGDAPVAVSTTAQRVRSGLGSDGAFVGFDVLVTDAAGRAIPCGTGSLSATVAVSRDGGPFEPVGASQIQVTCASDAVGQLAIAVDNSGSEAGFLAPLRAGVDAAIDAIAAVGGEASLVRVSTTAQVLAPLTSDAATLRAAADRMFVANGWTALYDGVRLANETLGGRVVPAAAADRFPDVAAFCAAGRKHAIAVFTDGRDNNSADEHAADYDTDAYPGDGIDTSLEDLYNLRVGSVTTPVYAIGLGDEVDGDALAALALGTGGRYLPIDDAGDLAAVFPMIADYAGATHQVCAELPGDGCGDVDLRIDYEWTDGVDVIAGSRVEHIHVDCPAAPAAGRTATVLLTLSNPGIPRDDAGTLAANVARWVSPVAAPRVLVVLDDNHHGEFAGDADTVAALLAERGIDADRLDEPADGIAVDAFAGYDVVWLSNPGYPPDDRLTIDALSAFAEGGGGVVLQGDDMTWSFGHAFSMAGLTHLDHIDNGVRACGKKIDDNRGRSYEVTLDPSGHPVVAGLDGLPWMYGDDIDRAAPRGEGERVAAWARFEKGSCAVQTPAIVVFDPADAAAPSM